MSLEVFADYHDKESKGHPEVDMSKLTIYGNIICPFVRRAFLILVQKNIPYNFIGIDLHNKPNWYLEMYPLGKVPYFKHGDKALPESLVIVNYLDEVYPPSIHPSDPYEKARGSLLVDEFCSPLFTPIKCLKDTSLSPEDKIKEMNGMFSKLETLFSKIKTKYFQTDDKPLYSDYMVWPFLEMVTPISLWMNHPTIKSVESLAETYPKTGTYLQNMMKDPAVKKVSPQYDTFKAYYDKFYGSS